MQARYAYLPEGDRRCRHEVASGRRVRFDAVIEKAAILKHATLLWRRDAKVRRPLIVDDQAELPHHGNSHAYIRLRHHDSVNFDGRVFLREGSGHEKSAQKLAACVGSNVNISPTQSIGVYDDRWAAVIELCVSFDSELVQTLQQVLNGPLAHPLDAVKSITTFAESDQGC